MGSPDDTVNLRASWKASHVLPKFPLWLSSGLNFYQRLFFFGVRNVLNQSKSVLGKDLLTTFLTDYDRGKVESPMVPGVWTERGTARGWAGRDKELGNITEGRRTLWDDHPKFRSSGAQSDGV